MSIKKNNENYKDFLIKNIETKNNFSLKYRDAKSFQIKSNYGINNNTFLNTFRLNFNKYQKKIPNTAHIDSLGNIDNKFTEDKLKIFCTTLENFLIFKNYTTKKIENEQNSSNFINLAKIFLILSKNRLRYAENLEMLFLNIDSN